MTDNCINNIIQGVCVGLLKTMRGNSADSLKTKSIFKHR